VVVEHLIVHQVLPEVLVVVQVDGKIQVHLLNQVVLVILHQLVLHKEIQVVNQDLQVQEPQLVQVVVEQQDQVQMFVVVQTQLDQVELEHLTQ
jgi:ethanolamine transporter EutH